MNLWGVLFMALSWGLILSLTVFSFALVLGGRNPKKENQP